METVEVEAFVKNCPYSNKSIDSLHTCDLEFHYQKICPSSKCICAVFFGLKDKEVLDGNS
jgi:hypothetical protein